MHDIEAWRFALRRNLALVNRSIVRNSLVQGGLNLLALAMMFALYGILRRREREIEAEKAKAKNYFFSTVSHDIRTPLNAIIGFSEMLQTGFKTEAERQQAIDSILVSGKTLLGLINDVLDLSKLESGKMEIRPEPTDCSRLLNGVMDAFRVSSGKPGLELRCAIGTMPVLMLDPQRIRQIVFNLVGNAVKFTEKGHVELRAYFDRTGDGTTGTCGIEVEDTGCGISKEDLVRLGSAYVQVGDKRARNGGTGLGLAICQQLVMAMGGQLEVTSEAGQGSTFSITIPGVRTAEPVGTNATSGAHGKMPVPSVPLVSSVSSAPIRRILLVDDSKMNLSVLKAHLKKLGDYEIALAMDGQEALAVLEASGETPFDLVFTDMWMPNLDGEGLVKAIRANPALDDLRVIVVTADVELRGKATEIGFDDILLKPITAENLVHILNEGNR